MNPLDDVALHAAALAGLPGMTPVRLAKLLDGFQPVVAWQAVRAGTHPADPKRRFSRPARSTELGSIRASYEGSGVRALLPEAAAYPSMLVGDPGAPAVLFALGDPTVLEGRPRVAIVGTRSATHYGRQVASELAGDLAAEGVVVVSGLARGIDGAAHAGALRAASTNAAPPVAVVGTGLDVVYPASNGALWQEVATQGAIVSESALGTQPHPGVFPARNRIIAALSDVVVVVESHLRGGSLYTAEAAARRSIPVCAVPGSVRSRASEGTNALLVDGCTPVRDATDVLVAISLVRSGSAEGNDPVLTLDAPVDSASHASSPSAPESPSGGVGLRTPIVAGPPTAAPTSCVASRSRRARSLANVLMSGAERTVWEAVDDTPTAFETILIRTDMSVASVAEACDRLVERGLIHSGAGWWSRN